MSSYVRKSQKGGSEERQPKVVTNQVYGFKEGSNPRQSALKYQQNMNAEQNNLNQTGGVNHKGEKLSRKTKNSERKRKTKKHDKIYSSKHIRIKQKQVENTKKKGNIKGGSGSGRNTTVTVPQFNPPGPKVSPLDPNSASVKGNQNSLQADANASGDCYATNSCGKKGGTRRGGRRRGGTRRRGGRRRGGTRRRGGRRRGGTRRGGGRRRGGTSLIRNKWGCMSGGDRECSSETIKQIGDENENLIEMIAEANNNLKILTDTMNAKKAVVTAKKAEAREVAAKKKSKDEAEAAAAAAAYEENTEMEKIPLPEPSPDDYLYNPWVAQVGGTPRAPAGPTCTNDQKQQFRDLEAKNKELKKELEAANDLIKVNKGEEI